jgi:uncharacterized protein YodC (DUF2158 family)
MERKFKVGDKVRLKSGGPEMTVENYVTQPKFKRDEIGMYEEETAKVKICYFDETGGKKCDIFEQDMLEFID